MNDPNLAAERSFLKETNERETTYGLKNTVRIDVLEAAPNDTVCAYDIKTGKKGLIKGRMAEIAQAAARFRPNTRRIIVTEIRPF